MKHWFFLTRAAAVKAGRQVTPNSRAVDGFATPQEGEVFLSLRARYQ